MQIPVSIDSFFKQDLKTDEIIERNISIANK